MQIPRANLSFFQSLISLWSYVNILNIFKIKLCLNIDSFDDEDIDVEYDIISLASNETMVKLRGKSIKWIIRHTKMLKDETSIHGSLDYEVLVWLLSKKMPIAAVLGLFFAWSD